MASRISGVGKAYARNPAVAKAAVAKPKPAAPVVPAPGAVAAPLPWDAHYDQQVGGINLTHDNTLASLANEQAGVQQAYGFDDLSNPFSRLALLKEKFANQQSGTTNSMAAQGQLYSGAIANQRGADQHGYDINYDTTRRDYNAALDGIAARRTAANDAQTNDTTAASWDRVQAALANRPDPASVPAAPVAAAPAVLKPKPTTLLAAPGAKGVTTTKKGKTVTYTNAVKRP